MSVLSNGWAGLGVHQAAPLAKNAFAFGVALLEGCPKSTPLQIIWQLTAGKPRCIAN